MNINLIYKGRKKVKIMPTNKQTQKINGITLIALVITIIVLLILAGVTIATLTGDNGILTQASDAKIKTEIAEVKERVQTDILGEQAGNNGELTKSKFIEILNRYFKDVPTEENFPEDLTTLTLETKEEYGSYNIKISEIYNVKFEKEKEYIETATSYVGYYADIDGNGTVDGMIYADLAVGGSGVWNNDSRKNYEYSAVTEGLKNYYVIQTGYEGVFGTKDVLAPDGSGQDRFYIMALEDVNPGRRYCWYDAAFGLLDKTVATNYNDFGQGRANSEYVMAKWDDASLPWGAHDNGTYYLDLWGVIKDKYEEGWFVPSKAEWSAFGDYLYKNCGLTKSNYSTYGLSDYYWSSSQGETYNAYGVDFRNGSILRNSVNVGLSVRLSATF